MASKGTPHFQNDLGVTTIHVGSKEFMCIGAKPPIDHPHIFIDLGASGERVCPYCSTVYRHNPRLHGTESNPPGHLFVEPLAA